MQNRNFILTPRLVLRSIAACLTDNIRLVTVLLSLLISAGCIYTHTILNNDGIRYIHTAQRLLAGDWHGAYTLYPWLFYPWLIALISQFSGLGLEASAQVLDALLSALMVWVFVTLVREFGGDRQVLVIAAFVILFHPYLNENRAELLRDHGYQAFYLLGVLCFVCHYRRPSRQRAVSWGVAMTTAMLFRIEGCVLLLLLPMVLWLQQGIPLKERLRYFLQAHIITGLLLSGLLVWIVLDPDISQKTGRLYEPITQLQDFLTAINRGLYEKAGRLCEAVLNRYSSHYALAAVIAILLLILLDTVVKTLKPLYCILPFCRSLWIRFHPHAGLIAILIWLIILNVIIALLFLTNNFYLIDRHVVALSLTVLIVIPFLLATLYDDWRNRSTQPPRRIGVFWVVAVFLLLMTADGFLNLGGSSKTYLLDAGAWLRENLPPGTSLYTNSRQLNYYSGYPIDWNKDPTIPITEALLQTEFWKPYAYLALAIDWRSPAIQQRLTQILGPPIQTFQNRRKDTVLIYKVREHQPPA
jgi:hypothetical protein